MLFAYKSSNMTKKIGLGTLVKAVLKPFVYVFDKVFKADLKNCDKCGCRERYLNGKMPNVNPLSIFAKK